MKIRLLIILGIIVIIAGIVMIYDKPLRYEIESDFLNKIKEVGDNSEVMTITVISKQDLTTEHIDYCGHAHMEVEEYWYFADTYKDVLLSSDITQNMSPWCEDDDDSCYCQLRERIGVDRSYEDFFRKHVSTTCPVIPMPENITSFDPIQCKWVETDERRHGWTPSFEYHRVQINGTTASQICSLLEITCPEIPTFDAINRHDKNYTYFYYELPNTEYLVKIDDGQICYTTDDVLTERTGLFERCVEMENED